MAEWNLTAKPDDPLGETLTKSGLIAGEIIDTLVRGSMRVRKIEGYRTEAIRIYESNCLLAPVYGGRLTGQLPASPVSDLPSNR